MTPVAPASTVVVLRDADRGVEVFMVRRHHAVAFMAGAHVFPGGRVDALDFEADTSWCDGVNEAARNLPGLSVADAQAFHVAALRELFEESGLLLARDGAHGIVTLAGERRSRLTALRQELNAGRRSFRDVVVGEGLRLALDTLVAFAHWVTPPIDIRRYDTRFFVTRLPTGQLPGHNEQEATESAWFRPRDAIAAAERGTLNLPPPTWATLREVERFDAVDEALSWARTRTVRRREPQVTEHDGVRMFVLPGDPAYPESEPVAFETRFVLKDGRWQPEVLP